jgi:hypothetical protein
LVFGRVIVIMPDNGLDRSSEVAVLAKAGNGYIEENDPNECSKRMRAWILDETGYQSNGDGTCMWKSRVGGRKLTGPDGEAITQAVKTIGFWSKALFEEAITAKEDGFDLRSRDRALMGYNILVTSETGLADTEVIARFNSLSRTGDAFNVAKSDLGDKPLEHVLLAANTNVQALVCFVALAIVRMIQLRVLRSQGKDASGLDGWESGMSEEDIAQALLSYTADMLPGIRYKMNVPDEDLITILDAFGVEPCPNLPTGDDLRSFKAKLADAAATPLDAPPGT